MTPEYPLPGFPRITRATLEDWVEIDGRWHSIVYVWQDAFPALYIDGKPAIVRGEFAFYPRVLTGDEIAEHYRVSQRGRWIWAGLKTSR